MPYTCPTCGVTLRAKGGHERSKRHVENLRSELAREIGDYYGYDHNIPEVRRRIAEEDPSTLAPLIDYLRSGKDVRREAAALSNIDWEPKTSSIRPAADLGAVPTVEPIKHGFEIVWAKSAGSGLAHEYRVDLPTRAVSNVSHVGVLNWFGKTLRAWLTQQVRGHPVRVNIGLSPRFIQQATGEPMQREVWMWSHAVNILRESQVPEAIQQMYSELIAQIEGYNREGSGFAFVGLDDLRISVSNFRDTSGGTYIVAPETVSVKKCIINVENTDDKCFAYAVLSALHVTDIKNHPERPSHYKKWMDELTFEGELDGKRVSVSFPVEIDSIETFERLNAHLELSFTVFDVVKDDAVDAAIIKRRERVDAAIKEAVEANKVAVVKVKVPEKYHAPPVPYQVRYMPRVVRRNHINLLLIREMRGEFRDKPVCHYAWIKNLSAFMRSTEDTLNKMRKFYCNGCH